MTLQPNNNLKGRSAAERLYELFRGAEQRHGTYDVKRLRLVGSKMEMKDEAGNGPRDVKGRSSPELWEKHLAGARPLGVSPLREDGMSRVGVVDIDLYDGGIDHGELASKIRREGLPLVLTRSKSGGGHVWLFASDWMPQAAMNAALTALACRLGHPDAETYPPATGLGNWMNMPYFGGETSDRYGVKAGGLGMAVAEFLETAEKARQSPTAIAALTRPPAPEGVPASGEDTDRAARKLAASVTEIAEAPEGGRAKLLYGLSKDMGKMIGAGWIEEDVVFDALMEAATRARLPYGEAVGHVRKGIKDGRQQPPDASDGDGGDLYPRIEKLVVRTGGETVEWRLTLSGYGDITLPVKEIMNYFAFNVHCASQLGAVYRHMKVNDWNERLRDAARGPSSKRCRRTRLLNT